MPTFFFGNCFWYDITALNSSQKDENVLKKMDTYKNIFRISFLQYVSRLYFLELIFYFRMSFLFFFQIFISETQKALLNLFF